MITHAIVTKVYKSDKDKSGKAYLTKGGKPYWKVGIKTDKTGEDWYSCLCFATDDAEYKLEEGKETPLVLEKGQYNNFRIPTKFDLMDARVTRVEQWIRKEEANKTVGLTSVGTKVPDFNEVNNKVEDINPNDIPWE
jgi:hypothetical protein